MIKALAFQPLAVDWREPFAASCDRRLDACSIPGLVDKVRSRHHAADVLDACSTPGLIGESRSRDTRDLRFSPSRLIGESRLRHTGTCVSAPRGFLRLVNYSLPHCVPGRLETLAALLGWLIRAV